MCIRLKTGISHVFEQKFFLFLTFFFYILTKPKACMTHSSAILNITGTYLGLVRLSIKKVEISGLQHIYSLLVGNIGLEHNIIHSYIIIWLKDLNISYTIFYTISFIGTSFTFKYIFFVINIYHDFSQFINLNLILIYLNNRSNTTVQLNCILETAALFQSNGYSNGEKIYGFFFSFFFNGEKNKKTAVLFHVYMN